MRKNPCTCHTVRRATRDYRPEDKEIRKLLRLLHKLNNHEYEHESRYRRVGSKLELQWKFPIDGPDKI